jgi:hypothetical protein
MWHSKNRLDGETKYLLGDGQSPMIFNSRAKARTVAQIKFGYIKTRADLRAEPHGWRMPRPVRVKIEAL